MADPLLFGGVRLVNRPDLENVRRLDLLPIPFIRRAHRLGFAYDKEHSYALTSKFSHEILSLEKDIASYIPVDRLREFSDRESGEADPFLSSFNASSAEQVGKLLFDMLGIGGDKPLRQTKGGGRLSTGKKQLELIRLDHPVVPLVLRHRELKKLITTYTDSLPDQALFHPRGNCCPVCELPHDIDQWRVHGEMGTTRAETGRINHKNPNLGNIPIRTADGRDVQSCFIAPPGKRLVARDLSQIELRNLAHLSRDRVMLRIYQEGGDIHDNTARKVFKLDDDVKPDKYNHRLPSKRCIAEGQRVLTDKGLTPIERVRKHDLIWDGLEFCMHAGVVKNGHRHTICYEGLCATADHEVWTDAGVRVTLLEAAQARQALMQTGDGIYTREYRQTGWPYRQVGAMQDGGELAVYDILNAGQRNRYTVENKLVANCNFSIQNGTTEKGLYLQIVMDYGTNGMPVPSWLTEDWCVWFIQEWLKEYADVPPFFEQQWYRARRYGLVWEPLGRVRPVPEVKSYLRWVREAGLRQAQNMPVTSFAAGHLKLAMGKVEPMSVALYESGVWVWPLLTIHDAIMHEADEDVAEDVLDMQGMAMDTCMNDEETGECVTRTPVLSDGEVMFDEETGVSRWKKG